MNSRDQFIKWFNHPDADMVISADGMSWQGWKASRHEIELTNDMRRIAYETFCRTLNRINLSMDEANALYKAIESVLEEIRECE